MRTETPPLAPKLTDNVTVHIVLNDFGKLGRAFLETDELEADEWTTVSNIITANTRTRCEWWLLISPRDGLAMSPRILRRPYSNAERPKVT
jgi:hypothetical protein